MRRQVFSESYQNYEDGEVSITMHKWKFKKREWREGIVSLKNICFVWKFFLNNEYPGQKVAVCDRGRDPSV